MKIEGLITDVTPVEFPDRAERAISGLILAKLVFCQLSPFLRSGRHFVMNVGTSFRALITLLRAI